MNLSDIAISQPCSCFCNKLAFRSETQLHNSFLIGNGASSRGTFSWKALCTTENAGRHFFTLEGGRLMVKAVATLEIPNEAHRNKGVKGYKNMLGVDLDSVIPENLSNSEPLSSSEESTSLGYREKLRRKRISKANKGNTPWNKGKKHSPETLQLIKERTRLAMQDPKVRMKLVNLGHAQSVETRIKIAVGVRLGWERRRKKQMVQETCHYDWQNLIVEAARKGLLGEEQLQWDSYEVLNKELEKEWLQSVEQRRKARRPKDGRRAPKSAEQRRKIAEAIAAKWTDPEYRHRVCNGQAKFYGIPEGVERKPRRKPSGDVQAQKMSHVKKDETKIQIKRTLSKRSKSAPYKDPSANSKLEMLKSIREERTSAMNNKSVAVARTKLLIAEATKAAVALERAATKENHFAQESLIESRILIAEASQIIEAIENGEEVTPSKHETDQNSGIIKHRKVNGTPNVNVSRSFSAEMGSESDEKLHQMTSNGSIPSCKPKYDGSSVEKLESQQVNLTKKWVRGRLVEVAEEI